eukprot:scaffold1931_cov162-Amphora_coffeaeformis.AAC.2
MDNITIQMMECILSILEKGKYQLNPVSQETTSLERRSQGHLLVVLQGHDDPLLPPPDMEVPFEGTIAFESVGSPALYLQKDLLAALYHARCEPARASLIWKILPTSCVASYIKA